MAGKLHLSKTEDCDDDIQNSYMRRRGALLYEGDDIVKLLDKRSREDSITTSDRGEWIDYVSLNKEDDSKSHHVASDGDVYEDENFFRDATTNTEELQKMEEEIDIIVGKKKARRNFSNNTLQRQASVDSLFLEQLIDEYYIFNVELDAVYLVAMSTLLNVRETPGELTKAQLMSYVQKVFDLSEDTMQELIRKASTTESPDLKLLCRVCRASGLTPKDANGKSDPYCRLGVLRESLREKHIVKQKNLADWFSDGLIEEVELTSIKPATLEPEWNEELELSLKNPKEEQLVLEVWDSDDPQEGASKVKGIKGLRGFGNFLADLRKGDDFMGRMFYPLQSLPLTREEKTFTLTSHSGKSKHGFIVLSMAIQGVKKNVCQETCVWEHTMLTRALINEDSRDDGRYIRRWDGVLGPEAEKLLEHYAILNGLNQLQRACVRLNVLIKYHRLYAVKMTAFTALIRTIKENRSSFPSLSPPLSNSKSNTEEEPIWVKQLISDLNDLAYDIEGLLKNHLSLFNIKSSEDVKRLEDFVQTLSELYSFRMFTRQLSPDKKNMKVLLENCIAVAIPNWYILLNARLLPQLNTPTEHLDAFKRVCEHCLHQCQRALKAINPIFMKVGVDYFTHFYVALDQLFRVEGPLKVQEFRDITETGTFEIYLSCRGMAKIAQYVDKTRRGDLLLPKCHLWFKDMVIGWFKVATERCKNYICKAIKLDEAICVTEDVKFSTSAVDTVGFLLQIGYFWKHLDWPIASVAYGYCLSIMERICECAQFYVGEVFQSLQDRNIMYDDQGRFRASEKLCIILNNMHHVRQALLHIPNKLELQSFYDWLEGEEKIGEKAKTLIDKLLKSADEDFGQKIMEVVLKISEKLTPDIQSFIHDMLQNGSSELSDEDAIDPLMRYLSENLRILGRNLFSPVFQSILLGLWEVSVTAVDMCAVSIPVKKGIDSARLNQRLYSVLLLLKEFYHSGGDGLSEEDINSESYTTLLNQLDVLRLPTIDLIPRFFHELAQRQESAVKGSEKPFGNLLLTVSYLRDQSAVNVNIIQAQKLPGLDKSGFSDPFVQLTLMPLWMFPESASETHKTTIKNQTLDPYYDESFILPSKEVDMDKDGTVLLLTIFDHDVIGSNDFAGMCVVACKSIPRLRSTKASFDPATTQPKNLNLPLFQLTTKTAVLSELHTRSKLGDFKAIEFFKSNRKLLGSFPQFHSHGSFRGRLGTS